MNTPHPLKVLIVEDYENDAMLLELELQRAGYEIVCLRVDTPEAMREALAREEWHVIIADYVMPHFNGLAALGLVKEMGLDLPFIIVSGHITDDTAVAAMKAGAHDYVMKGNLARLGSAVRRELRDAEIRFERRRSEEKLKAESTFRQAIENSVPSGIAAVDLEGRQTYVNPAFCQMVGWKESELVGARPPFLYWPPEEVDSIQNALVKLIEGNPASGGTELRFKRHSGERIDVLLQMTPLKDSFSNVTGWVAAVTNITERKRAELRLAAEHSITRILANAPTLEDAAPGIMQVLLDSLQVDVATLWILDQKYQTLIPSIINTRVMSEPLKKFIAESRRFSFARGESLPGRVWQERRTVWVTEISIEGDFRRRDLATEAGLHSGFAFPIQQGVDFFGLLEFFTQESLPPDRPLANMMMAIGSEMGQFIQRRAAQEALRRANDELEMRVARRTEDLKTANERLEMAIAERKRLEHELLEITEKERRRIGLDLHDDLGQKLSGIALMTKGLELKLAKHKAPETEDAGRIHTLIQQAMTHASDLAHDLATLDLKGADLSVALTQLANRARELFAISCRFKADMKVPELEGNVVGQLYKIAQEAVTNAIKHGKAKRVDISLSNGSGRLLLTIQNNGKAFPDLKSGSTGMGLRIMNYRASLIGASLEVKGVGTRGTLVSCSLPIAAKQ